MPTLSAWSLVCFVKGNRHVGQGQPSPRVPAWRLLCGLQEWRALRETAISHGRSAAVPTLPTCYGALRGMCQQGASPAQRGQGEGDRDGCQWLTETLAPLSLPPPPALARPSASPFGHSGQRCPGAFGDVGVCVQLYWAETRSGGLG